MSIFRRIFLIGLMSLALFAAGALLREALRMYQQNTLKDHPEALAALRDEAQKGNTDAAFLLATSYRGGRAGRVDFTRALKWYEKAASLGDADAMLMLGWLYYKGGPSHAPDEALAKRWFRKAAERGVDEAVEMLEILREG